MKQHDRFFALPSFCTTKTTLPLDMESSVCDAECVTGLLVVVS